MGTSPNIPFKGSIVRVLDEDQSCVVVQVRGNLFTVLLNETGFEQDFFSYELVLAESLAVNSTPIVQKVLPKNKKPSEPKAEEVVDLHFGQLVDFPNSYQPHERLTVQLQAVETALINARKSKLKKLILVHGHGQGVLREKVCALLKKTPNIEFYDASWQRYKGGATEVSFF